MSIQTLYERIETLTGQSIETLQKETLSDKRNRVSAERHKTLRFTRNFPLIGRGCVLGDHLRTRDELNQELNELLDSGR